MCVKVMIFCFCFILITMIIGVESDMSKSGEKPYSENETTTTSTTTKTTATPLPHMPIYRMFNGIGHFYTTDKAEYQHVMKTFSNFKYEGISGYVVMSPEGSANVSIHRSYLRWTDDHLYGREAEKNVLVMIGWSYEGIIGFCSDTPQTNMSAWVRFYNPSVLQHFMTNNQYEVSVIIANPKVFRYNEEGPLCYVYDN